jgi:hypothetical protein
MTRSVAAALFVSCVCVFGSACREEPTIVIRFEPNDLAGVASAKVGDGGTSAAAKVTVSGADAGAAAVASVKKAASPECKLAADCTVVPLDCCDCANGGKQHAIAAKALAAAKAARAERCAHTMCTMMLSTDPSCGQRADCVAGVCVMAAAKKKK